MNEIVNKFLLAGDEFMPEMKRKERIQKFKEIVDTNYIYKNELDKACFKMTWLMEILKI